MQAERQDGYPIGMICRVRFFNADDKVYFEDITGSCRIESTPYRMEVEAVYLDDPTETVKEHSYSSWGQDATILECSEPKLAAEFCGKKTFIPNMCLLP